MACFVFQVQSVCNVLIYCVLASTAGPLTYRADTALLSSEDCIELLLCHKSLYISCLILNLSAQVPAK